jgi:Right handed beta helix region/Fibronectin type III domain/Kelch motif
MVTVRRLMATVTLVAGLVLAGTPSNQVYAIAGSVGVNQWECSVSDPSAGCSATDLSPMLAAEDATVSATAPCPRSMDTCVYDVGSGRTVQAYDVSTGSWISSDRGGQCANSSVLACLPDGLSGVGAVEDLCPGTSDACIYVLGGADAGGTTVRATVQAFDTGKNRWITSDLGAACVSAGSLPCMPTARSMLGVVTAECPLSSDRCVYAIGGFDANGVASRAVEAFDPVTGAWVSSEAGGNCANAAVRCMPEGLAGSAVGGAPCPKERDWCVYLAGGVELAGGQPVQTVEAYDPGTNNWLSSDTGGSCVNASVLACLPADVEGAGAVGGQCPSGPSAVCLYVIGGTDGTQAVATNRAFDAAANQWFSSDDGGACANGSEIACMPSPRTGAGVAAADCPGATGSCIWVSGGGGESGALATVEAYNTGQIGDRAIYAAPWGSDANPGTYFFPLADLETAQSLVRSFNGNMTTDISVYLENGTYRLKQPLQFGVEDSGRGGHEVRWRAAPGETPIISGGERITGWRISDPKKNIWVADLPADLKTRQLYIDGMRASMTAELPPVKLKETAKGYLAGSALMAHWRNPGQMEFSYSGTPECYGPGCHDVGLGRWTYSMCPIGSIKGRKIVMAQPCWFNTSRRRPNLVGHLHLPLPNYLMNAFELLKKPGQFYVDGRVHRVYYIPRDGEDMATVDAEVPGLEYLLNGAGTAGQPIHDLNFEGLEFAYATWLQPSSKEGFSEVQANYTITGPKGYKTEGLCHVGAGGTCPYGAFTKEPGNVQFSYDRNLSFIDDRFLHLGAAGLNLDDGSRNALVEGCVFTDISGNGLEIGNVDMPLATADAKTETVTVANNHIYGIAVEFHGGVGVLVGYAADTTVSHNQIDHVPYTAISVGWGGWPERISHPPTENFSQGNLISDNLIFDLMALESDGGGVYNQGTAGTSFDNGEHVNGNVVYGLLDWGRALQSDQGTTYITYSGNVLYDNNYDWGTRHLDTAVRDGRFDPTQVIGNYWQQGDPDSSSRYVTESGNHLISGASEAPPSITENAGVTTGFRSLLAWRPLGTLVPAPPGSVESLYAFGSEAYVTWRPTVSQGNAGVTSYTVSCDNGVPPVTISDAEYQRLGYAVISGLTQGVDYRCSVRAVSALGTGTPSPLSAPIVPSSSPPPVPGAVHSVEVNPGEREVEVQWYANRVTGYILPVLAFQVTISTGDRTLITGLSHLVVSSYGGRVVAVFSDLTPGHAYRFAISEINPGGVGPPVISPSVTPQG